jgi:hypothetical protein
MAKTKRKKPTSIVLQREEESTLVVVNRDLMRGHQPNQYKEADLQKWAEAALGKDLKLKLKEKIVLSAAHTVVSNKAWLNATSCRNIYPGNPGIEFINDRSDFFGGKLEFWLENLSGAKKLQFVLRMTGYTQGSATITVQSSVPTAYSLIPVDISGSMNLTLGNVLQIPSNTPGGLALLTLDVQFHNAQYGSWQFVDVTFTEVT